MSWQAWSSWDWYRSHATTSLLSLARVRRPDLLSARSNGRLTTFGSLTVLRPVPSPKLCHPPPCARPYVGGGLQISVPTEKRSRLVRVSFSRHPSTSGTQSRGARVAREAPQRTRGDKHRSTPRPEPNLLLAPSSPLFSNSLLPQSTNDSSFRSPAHLFLAHSIHYPVATMTRLADDPSKAMAIGVGMCALSFYTMTMDMRN